VWAEVKILEKLQHPNIVQLVQTTWDFNSNPKRFDIILELVSGGSLQTMMKRFGPFNEKIT